MNWEKFRDTLDQNVNLNTRLKSLDDIEIATQSLINLIQTTAWNSSTTKPSRKYSNPFSIPSFARELITQMRRIRALWQRTRLLSDKNIYNNLSLSLKHIVNQLKNSSFNSWSLSLLLKMECSLECYSPMPKSKT